MGRRRHLDPLPGEIVIDTRLLLNALLHLLPVLYAVTLFDYLLVFVSEDKLVRRLARPLLATSVGLNFVYLLVYTVYFEHVPLVTVYQVLGAVGFALAAIYLWVEGRTGSPYTGPFILFLVLVFQVLSSAFPKFDHEVPEMLQSRLFSFHVVAATMGYTAFAVAAVHGLLYLLLYRRMRTKDFGLVFRRMPPLDTLEGMNFSASVIGFAFLLLAAVFGAIWSKTQFGHIVWDPKLIVVAVTLLIFGAAIVGRRMGSWRGTRLAYSSLVGFIVVLFSLFGVNFFLTSFHGFLG